MINSMLAGAIVMALVILSLFFLRFWKSTHDRFFLFFSAAFFLEGITRTLLGINPASLPNEIHSQFYIIRLMSYLLILIAIYDKNRSTK